MSQTSDQSDVNTRSFRSPSSTHHWKRLALPASAAVALGALAIARGTGIHALQEHYSNVRIAWMQVPAICTQDFPLTQFQTEQCDHFWKAALWRLGLVSAPFVLAASVALWLRRRQKALYAKTLSRLASSAHVSRASTERPGEDLFSWFYSVKPATAVVEGEKKVVYLSFDTPDLKGEETLAVYELGRYLGKPRWIALIEKPPVRRVRDLQKTG